MKGARMNTNSLKCPGCGMPTILDQNEDLYGDELLCTLCYQRMEEDMEKKSTHTPGPWKINSMWGIIQGPEYEEICAVHAAMQEGDLRRVNKEIARHNARLIAAAPDLLAALKVAKAILNDDIDLTDADYEQVERAIAKAEGRG